MKHLTDLLTLRHRRLLFRSSVRPSVYQHLCGSLTFMYLKLPNLRYYMLLHLNLCSNIKRICCNNKFVTGEKILMPQLGIEPHAYLMLVMG